MAIFTGGIDLAKNVFAVHGVNESGKAVLVKPKVAREAIEVLHYYDLACLRSDLNDDGSVIGRALQFARCAVYPAGGAMFSKRLG